jgi:hypothetical protein
MTLEFLRIAPGEGASQQLMHRLTVSSPLGSRGASDQ